MAKKFHIGQRGKAKGKIVPCQAKSCSYGEHFDSVEAGDAYLANKAQEEFGTFGEVTKKKPAKEPALTDSESQPKPAPSTRSEFSLPEGKLSPETEARLALDAEVREGWRKYPHKPKELEPPLRPGRWVLTEAQKKLEKEHNKKWSAWHENQKDLERRLNEAILRERQAHPAPQRPDSIPSGLWGLESARLEALQNESYKMATYAREDDPNKYYYGTPETMAWNIEDSLNHAAAGTARSHVADPQERNYGAPAVNKILEAQEHPEYAQQVYLATGFTEKELKEAFDRYGVQNVSVSSFNNGREWGLAYTALQPDGSTRTFSVYEHRNHDSLVINGKTNWNHEEDPHGPYAVDSKYEFFAEHSVGEFRQAAESLAFFLKEAERGDLPGDEELAAKAEHLDWDAIISQQLGPVWDDFKKRHGGKGPDDPMGTNDPRKLGF